MGGQGDSGCGCAGGSSFSSGGCSGARPSGLAISGKSPAEAMAGHYWLANRSIAQAAGLLDRSPIEPLGTSIESSDIDTEELELVGAQVPIDRGLTEVIEFDRLGIGYAIGGIESSGMACSFGHNHYHERQTLGLSIPLPDDVVGMPCDLIPELCLFEKIPQVPDEPRIRPYVPGTFRPRPAPGGLDAVSPPEPQDDAFRCLYEPPVLGEAAGWIDARPEFENINGVNEHLHADRGPGSWLRGTPVFASVLASPSRDSILNEPAASLSSDVFGLGSLLDLGFQQRIDSVPLGSAGYVDGFAFRLQDLIRVALAEGGCNPFNPPACPEGGPAGFRYGSALEDEGLGRFPPGSLVDIERARARFPPMWTMTWPIGWRLDVALSASLGPRPGVGGLVAPSATTSNMDGLVVGVWPVARRPILESLELARGARVQLMQNPWVAPQGKSLLAEHGTWGATFCAGDPAHIFGEADWSRFAANNEGRVRRHHGSYRPIAENGILSSITVGRLSMCTPSSVTYTQNGPRTPSRDGSTLTYMPSAYDLGIPMLGGGLSALLEIVNRFQAGTRAYPEFDVFSLYSCGSRDRPVVDCGRSNIANTGLPALTLPPLCNSVRILVSVIKLNEECFISTGRRQYPASGQFAASVTFQYVARDPSRQHGLVMVSLPVVAPAWVGRLYYRQVLAAEWMPLESYDEADGLDSERYNALFVGCFNNRAVRQGSASSLRVGRLLTRFGQERALSNARVVRIPLPGPRATVVQIQGPL